MFCKNCGKEVSDNAYICTNCGALLKEQPESEKKIAKENGLSISGFIISLVSIFISLFCIVPTVGLILSILGYVSAGKKNQKSRLGLAGIIIGAISLVFCFFSLIFGFALLEALF